MACGLGVTFARVEQAGEGTTETGTLLPDRCDHGRVMAWRDIERAEPQFAGVRDTSAGAHVRTWLGQLEI